MLRVGLLGCGRIARYFHLPALAGLDGVELAVVADPAPDALEHARGVVPGARLEPEWERVLEYRLVPEKGVDVLLRALADVRRRVPGTCAVVAGHGPERAALERLAADEGVADAVDFVGHLPREELEDRFAGAWVQVVPGLWEEPFGNVVTEAMARGTAVVASRIGGPAEIVVDGETGTLVAPGDVAALADALTALLGSPERSEAMGRAGRRRAIETYGPERVVARYEAIYRRAIAHHQQPRSA